MNNKDFLIGHFYKIRHTNDNDKNSIHPFLFLGRNKNRGLFIQLSSVKYGEGIPRSYFDEVPNSIIVDGDINDGLDFHSRANLSKLTSFKIDKLINEKILNTSVNAQMIYMKKYWLN